MISQNKALYMLQILKIFLAAICISIQVSAWRQQTVVRNFPGFYLENSRRSAFSRKRLCLKNQQRCCLNPLSFCTVEKAASGAFACQICNFPLVECVLQHVLVFPYPKLRIPSDSFFHSSKIFQPGEALTAVFQFLFILEQSYHFFSSLSTV